MRRAVLLVLWLTGCFYVDPINQRPAIDIRADSPNPIYRGDTVKLHAVAVDPEAHLVGFRWHIVACTDGTMDAQCDEMPVFSGAGETAVFMVPFDRLDPGVVGPTAVKSLSVVLDAEDEYGATAKPPDKDVLPVLDRDPTLTLGSRSKYEFVFGTPIELSAKYGDADDGAEKVTLAWVAYPPSGVTVEWTDTPILVDPEDPAHLQAGKRLEANAVGIWDIEVTARDPQDNDLTKNLPVTVVPDRAPCLEGLMPVVPQLGEHYPMFEPTLFQVPTVSDDLDRHPSPDVDDPYYGDPVFVWSLLAPGGGGRQVLPGVTGNTALLDPATYVPGGMLELRVEIFDRNATPITCADADPSCSVISTTCLQRQTWRIEVQ